MGKILVVKIKENTRGSEPEYKNRINFQDFKQLAIFFQDLELNGGKIEKAFQEFKKQKEQGFPW